MSSILKGVFGMITDSRQALSAEELQALYNLGQQSPLKTSIHLSRSNGYRELGMFDESIMECGNFNIRAEYKLILDITKGFY